MSSRISFGSFFAHPEACVGARGYIGSYGILGKAAIGDGTQVASGAQILSGQHQHIRDSSGAFHEAGDSISVTIGGLERQLSLWTAGGPELPSGGPPWLFAHSSRF